MTFDYLKVLAEIGVSEHQKLRFMQKFQNFWGGISLVPHRLWHSHGMPQDISCRFLFVYYYYYVESLDSRTMCL